jgi:hypothetical protein
MSTWTVYLGTPSGRVVARRVRAATAALAARIAERAERNALALGVSRGAWR